MSAAMVPFGEKIEKNKFYNLKKLNFALDRVTLVEYENDIFPTLSCDTVKIHHIN
jgi:hypothetical protein